MMSNRARRRSILPDLVIALMIAFVLLGFILFSINGLGEFGTLFVGAGLGLLIGFIMGKSEGLQNPPPVTNSKT